MSRKWLLSLLCLSAAITFAQLSTATSVLSLNESATRFLVEDQVAVAIEVVNPTKQRADVRLKLDLLDTSDVVRGIANRVESLKPGVNSFRVPLTLTADKLNSDNDKSLPWYRLRYQIEPLPHTKNPLDGTSGLISLSEIETPNLFALEVTAPRRTSRGMRYFAHVRAYHPVTNKPVKGVAINARLEFDEPQNQPQTSFTDLDGNAVVDLKTPLQVSDSDGEIIVVAQFGGFVQEISKNVDVSDNARIMITTDKTIYQPGQPLHVRALIFAAANRSAADAEATLTIEAPDGTNVFKADLRTSRFGVANADWTLPDNTRLGSYLLKVEMDDDNLGEAFAEQIIKVSRYDLPNFAVSVKTDRTYYLPGQHASVEVNADYLFGQPVKHGHIKIVREAERSWNYREQKWTVQEAESYEGDADKDGHFKTSLDLSKEHVELAEQDYLRFTDLRYAAYFTDPTTNRTEQRRFDLRLTKDAIHVYVSEGDYRQARELPLVFFVSTAYADGTPAGCEVAISEAGEDSEASSQRRKPLRIIRTNKYGVAKVSGLVAPVDKSGDKTSLALSARDYSRNRGRHTEDFYFRNTVLRVETNKALYKQGEPIEVNITSNVPDLKSLISVAAEGHTFQTGLVQLKNGMARLTIPHRPVMKDSVQVFAFHHNSTSDYYDSIYGSRTVLYPRERDLKFDVHLDNSTYRPGDDALAKFRIMRADGRPATSVLGVTIFDKAVEERARTDQEFGGQFGFSGSYYEWRGYNVSVGGVTPRDLERIDLKKPVSSEMETVAQMILGSSSSPDLFFEDSAFNTDHRSVFSELNKQQIAPLLNALNTEYSNHNVYPKSSSDLRRLLFEGGYDFSGIKDPWGNLYRDEFSIEQDKAVLQFFSAGPDKKFDTNDDFSAMRVDRPYFKFVGEAINRTVRNFHARTGAFIRDVATLKRELENEAVNLDVIRDPWGQPYRVEFTTTQRRFNILVSSGGPNKIFTPSSVANDDFLVWQSSIDYTGELKAVFEKTMREYFNKRNAIPREDKVLIAALDEFGVAERHLTDAWGHHYYGEYGRQSRNGKQVTLQTYASYGTDAKFLAQVVPVIQQLDTISLRSKGEDGKQATADDFEVARFSQVTKEEPSSQPAGKPGTQQVVFSGAKGAITGTVIDQAGGSVPGAKVKAVATDGTTSFETETDEHGNFILQNIPTGFYELRCEAPGFQNYVLTSVPVRSSNVTTVNLTLEVGTVSSVVEVVGTDAAQLNLINTTSAMLSSKQQIVVSNQISTPRLREYFPETLLWQPSLETNTNGQAQLRFKLADNITTWKMSLIASTEDGEIGTTETEFKAFQPFFAEHDPPRVLTEGDQISLPVVLRNYLEKNQTVNVEMKPEQWFSFVGPSQQKVDIAAGESAREVFSFRASASVKDGKQRVIVTGTEASDAIERPVRVHPDGQEITQTVGDVLVETSSMNINIPDSVIPGSIEAELKLYPNLFAHVAESIEGIMERPYGCGEQTISSTYPSLLFLAHNRVVRQDPRTVSKAQRYVQLGYQRLLNYREENGGFSYWGNDDANISLTAYALRFLNDVKPFVDTDEEILRGARQWLIKQQNPEGNWGDKGPNGALLTAHIARMLAITAPAQDPTATKEVVTQRSPELERALSYLRSNIETSNEPYLIASYALAAMEAADLQGAGRAVTKLRGLARSEGGGSYWALEASTPFHGWGLAGRIEATAIALEALVRFARTGSNSSNAGGLSDPLIRGGLLFLFKQKDRYGVWHSTQSTVNVLQTLVSLIANDSVNSAGAFAPIEVFVNGRPVKSIHLPPGNENVLIRENISGLFKPGDNRVDLKRAAGFSSTSVQVVTNYYVPWSDLARAQVTQRSNDQILLAVNFDKTDAMVNEEIACRGKIERVGRGYGMMLAEIGLPPGAEVDRASLEAAMKASASEISQYDVLPDRIVLYVWPRDGRVEFAFKFRPRFAMNAKTAPSTVSDYYNPEAASQIAPARFVVKL